MKIKLYVGTEEEYKAGYEVGQKTMEQYSEGINKRLQEALENGEKTLTFRSFRPYPNESHNFQMATLMEKAILEFTSEHEEIEYVSIVCDEEYMEKFFMVAYNFWFAGEKNERLMSVDWEDEEE